MLLTVVGFTAIIKALKQTLKKQLLKEILSSTMVVTAMIFATILTASMFSLVFIGLGGDERIAWIISAMPGGPSGALLFCMVLIFILGFFLDFVEISVILLPLIAPSLILMGHDPIWLSFSLQSTCRPHF